MINKKNIKNFLFLSSSEALSGFLFFIAMIYIARVLGPEAYGKMNVARSLILYFLMFVSAGLDFYGIREGARIPAQIKTLIEKIVTLRLILSVITVGLLLLMLQVFPEDLETRRLLLYYGGMIILTAVSLEWYYQSTERMGLSSAGRAISEIVFILLVLLLIRSPENLIWIPIARVLGTFAQQLFYWLIGIKELGTLHLSGNFDSWTKMLKISLPMGFGFIMVQIYYYLDSIMLKILADYEQVGFYSASYKILTAIILVVTMLNKAIYPQLSKLYKMSVQKMSYLLQDALKLMTIATVWIVFHGFILSEWGILLLYKEAFISSVPVFKILIFNLLVVGINGLFAYGLLASDNEKKYLISVSIGAIVNFILNLIFIPKFGMYGAAGTTILSELSLLIYYFWQYKKIEFQIQWNPIVAIILIGSVIFFPVLIFRNIIPLVLIILIFNILYFPLLMRLKLLPLHELGVLLNIDFLKRRFK